MTASYQTNKARGRGGYEAFWGQFSRVTATNVSGQAAGPGRGHAHLLPQERPGGRRAHGVPAGQRGRPAQDQPERRGQPRVSRGAEPRPRLGNVASMRIAVLSDTHSPRFWKGCPPAVAGPPRRGGPDPARRRRVHRRRAGRAVERTPRSGSCSATTTGPDVAAWGAPETLETELEGLAVAMVHDSGPAAGRMARMRRRFPGADLVVFGHSHIPMDLTENGLRIFNPGSPTDRRRQPYGTVGELEIADGRLMSRPGSSSCGDRRPGAATGPLRLRPKRSRSPSRCSSSTSRSTAVPDGTPVHRRGLRAAQRWASCRLPRRAARWPWAAGGSPRTPRRPARTGPPRSSGCTSRAEARGRGFGRLLLTALEDDAQAAGADWMVLETGQPQVAAVGLYRGSGYVDIAPYGFYADEPEVVSLGKRLLTGSWLGLESWRTTRRSHSWWPPRASSRPSSPSRGPPWPTPATSPSWSAPRAARSSCSSTWTSPTPGRST